jgi:hypothetical protein
MRPTEDEQQDARRAAWIESLPLSDPIFDSLFQAPEKTPTASEKSSDQE